MDSLGLLQYGEEDRMTQKEFFKHAKGLYELFNCINDKVLSTHTKAVLSPPIMGASANGSAIGWSYEKMSHKINDELRVFPAIGLHGGDNGRNRTRIFTGLVFKQDGKYIPTIPQWSYGIRNGEHHPGPTKEAEAYVAWFEMWWKAIDLKLLEQYLNKPVKNLYDQLAEEPAKKEYPEEKCISLKSDWFKKKLDREQTVLSAMNIVAKSAAKFTVRRQLDVLYCSNEIIRRNAFNMQVVNSFTVVNDIHNARKAMKSLEKKKDIPKKGKKK